MSNGQRRELEKNVFHECKSTEGGTDDDLNDLIQREVPETETGKCVLACAHEKMGLVSIVLNVDVVNDF